MENIFLKARAVMKGKKVTETRVSRAEFMFACDFRQRT